MILVRTVWATSSSCAPSNSRLAFFRCLLVSRILFVVSPELPSGNYSWFFLEALPFIHISSPNLLYLFLNSTFPPSSLFFLFSSQVDHDTRLIQADMDDYFSNTPSVPSLSSYSFFPRADSPADCPDSLYLRYFFPRLPPLIPSLLQPLGDSHLILILSFPPLPCFLSLNFVCCFIFYSDFSCLTSSLRDFFVFSSSSSDPYSSASSSTL